MVKICPKCGEHNPDEAFWCINCDYKLMNNSQREFEKPATLTPEPEIEKPPIMEEKIRPEDLNFEEYKDNKSGITAGLKIIIIPISIIIIFILAAVIMNYLSTVQEQRPGILDEIEINWNNVNLPWGDDESPWYDMNFPWTQSLNMDNIKNPFLAPQEFTNVAVFGQEYWYTGDTTVKTTDGWTFTIDKVQACSFNGVVLDTHVYQKDSLDYHATESISPIDIFFGIDNVYNNPNNYPYMILQRFYRGVLFQPQGDGQTNDYFTTHVTNTHLLPHNQNVFNTFYQIELKDKVTLTGYYVNVHGTKTEDGKTYHYTWNTDTHPGDWRCEVILVDSLVIN